MKYSFSFLGILFAVLSFIFLFTAGIAPSSDTQPEKKAPGVAVVELFTSQGCSSCPPADALLLNIAQQASEEELAIFPLSFHVDYWNRLGWKDPYSKPEFTDRQRQYAQSWKNAQIYTPQMVVNGQRGFVGSRQHQAWQAIENALREPATTSVELDLTVSSDRIETNYRVDGSRTGSRINIALVEKTIQTSVRKGENSGKTLHHIHVVRQFSSHAIIGQSSQGNITVHLPADLLPANALVIGYVQHGSDLMISGASVQPLVNS